MAQRCFVFCTTRHKGECNECEEFENRSDPTKMGSQERIQKLKYVLSEQCRLPFGRRIQWITELVGSPRTISLYESLFLHDALLEEAATNFSKI